MGKPTTTVEAFEKQHQRWLTLFTFVLGRLELCFCRREAKQRARLYLEALLSPIQRKNGWQIAEQCQDAAPYKTQHFLLRAKWDADELRDHVRSMVLDRLFEPSGTLVLDDTGFIKKGNRSCGVQRQYSGTAGKIENCQIGVFLAYATPKHAALIDRRLYLPQAWADNEQLRKAAKVPAETEFFKKTQLGQQMLYEALDSNPDIRWVAADSGYGGHYALRASLEERRVNYVLGIRTNQYVWRGFYQYRADELIHAESKLVWKAISCGLGTKGPRIYEWTRLLINNPHEGYCRWLLGRRNIENREEIEYFLAFAPPRTSLGQLAEQVGLRWRVEECFEHAKMECGLADYEVRTHTGWYRHITMSMLAFAFLSLLKHQTQQEGPSKKNELCACEEAR